MKTQTVVIAFAAVVASLLSGCGEEPYDALDADALGADEETLARHYEDVAQQPPSPSCPDYGYAYAKSTTSCGGSYTDCSTFGICVDVTYRGSLWCVLSGQEQCIDGYGTGGDPDDVSGGFEEFPGVNPVGTDGSALSNICMCGSTRNVGVSLR